MTCHRCTDTGLITAPGGYNTCTCAKGRAMKAQFGVPETNKHGTGDQVQNDEGNT